MSAKTEASKTYELGSELFLGGQGHLLTGLVKTACSRLIETLLEVSFDLAHIE